MKVQTAAVQIMAAPADVLAWVEAQEECTVEVSQLLAARDTGMWSFTAHFFPDQCLNTFLAELAWRFPG